MIKDGVKTTEFWGTIFTQIIGVLTISGIATAAQVSQLTQGYNDVVTIAKTVADLLTIVAPMAVYVYNRTFLKKQAVVSKVK